jgi:hypothetical protein
VCVPDPEVLPSYSKSNLHISGTMEELVKNAVSILYIYIYIPYKKKAKQTFKLSPWTNICATNVDLTYIFSIFSGAMYSP